MIITIKFIEAENHPHQKRRKFNFQNERKKKENSKRKLRAAFQLN